MPRKPTRQTKEKGVVYRFEIDAFTPATIPMQRLAGYMVQLAEILGEPASVHFQKLVKGSTVIATRIQHEAVPKVRARVSNVRQGNAPVKAMEAYATVNKMLREDNTVADLKNGVTLLHFPGKEEAKEEFSAVNQRGHIDGTVRSIGGRDATIHLRIEIEGRQVSGLYTNAAIARQLKWGDVVRLYGRGKWKRDSQGTWTLEEFKVEHFDHLDDAPIDKALEELRAIPTQWGDSAYSELDEIRHGPKGKRNGGH